MSENYLTLEQNLADLASRMPDHERIEFEGMGHLRLEPSFADRVFVLYKACGKDAKSVQRPPEIVTTIRIVRFIANSDTGCEARIIDENSQETMNVGHVPRKLFDFPLYLQVPPNQRINWDARRSGREVLRTLHFILLIKSANKAEFFSKGNNYLETPNKLRALYPHLDLDLKM